jgi:hypothetical protein
VHVAFIEHLKVLGLKHRQRGFDSLLHAHVGASLMASWQEQPGQQAWHRPGSVPWSCRRAAC